ncbi:merozoite surface protein CMZ-8-like [Schistocerca nitens]|uniref:merozoite surface protein CMZ-8-like n=1 Tax=Schistocerca nitens TaxID=7011 RepID=UPI0021193977|nr:merozoite surface protein CMZ-8-like [Schistocerca nitens]
MRFEGFFATLLVLCAISYFPGSLQRGVEGNADMLRSHEQLDDDGWYEHLLEADLNKEDQQSSTDNPPSTPDGPPSTPDEPPSTPDEPPSTPDEPPSTPDEPPSTPDEPPSTPDEPPSTPDEPPTTTEGPSPNPSPNTDSAFSFVGNSMLTVGATVLTLVISWGR